MFMGNRETVHQRAQRNGGYITSRRHSLMRRLDREKQDKSTAKPTPPTPAKTAKRAISMEESLDNRRDALRKAVSKLSKPGKSKDGVPYPTDSGGWVDDLTDDFVIFSKDGKSMAAAYCIDDDGEASLEEPFEVSKKVSYESVEA